MKQEILDRINEIIVDEKGVRVTMDSMFYEAELDSLGTMITLATIEADYPIFKDVPEEADAIALLDIPNLTIRDLVNKCRLSITDTSTEQNSKTES